MSDARAFQDAFGAALAIDWPPTFADPAMDRAVRVHRNTSAKAARDALCANFPVVHALVGSDAFAACADAHVRARPPREPRLCGYGAAFATHLANYEPFASAPYLADVGALEWLCAEALFAADAPTERGDGFADSIDPGSRLEPHPAVRCATFAHPAVSLWLAHQEEAPADALESIVWRAETALVTRSGYSLQVTVIDAASLAFLTAVMAGDTLGDAALAASDSGGDVAQTFAALISAGALCPIFPGDLS